MWLSLEAYLLGVLTTLSRYQRDSKRLKGLHFLHILTVGSVALHLLDTKMGLWHPGFRTKSISSPHSHASWHQLTTC